MSLNQIVHSEALPFLQGLPDGCVDLLVTDPPFGIGKASWDCWPSDTAYLAWLRPHIVAMRRVLKPNGSLYLFAAPQMAAKVEVLVGEELHVLNQIVWHKRNGTTNRRADREQLRCYLTSTERIIFAEPYGADSMALGTSGYAAKCEQLHGFLFEPLRAYLDNERKRAGISKAEVNAACGFAPIVGGMASRHYFSPSQWCLPTQAHYAAMQTLLNTRNGHTDYLRREYEDLRREYEDLRRPFFLRPGVLDHEVWTFATVPPDASRHIAEKPLNLLKHIISCSSRKGDFVVDCFCGSGSSLDAARQLNRNYLGGDSDPVWVTRAQQRLGAAYTPSLFADATQGA